MATTGVPTAATAGLAGYVKAPKAPQKILEVKSKLQILQKFLIILKDLFQKQLGANLKKAWLKN